VNAPGSAESLLGRLALAWQRLRASWVRSAGDPPGQQRARLCGRASGGNALGHGVVAASFRRFLAPSFFPVRERIARRVLRWTDVGALGEVTERRPAWDMLRATAGLDNADFVGFIRDLLIHFDPPMKQGCVKVS
jgi:hypothetical protein